MSADRFAPHRDQSTHRPVAGLTLTELMIVVAVLLILSAPIFTVFRSGSRTATQGMARAEVTLEARHLLRQVQDDLRSAVFVVDYANPTRETTAQIFDRMVTVRPNGTLSLLRFPLHGPVDAAIDTTSGGAYRIAVRVTYRLQPTDRLLYSLYRQEGRFEPTCLSRRVNFFSIRENPAAPPKTSWLVSLQLADIAPAAGADGNVERLEQSQGMAASSAQRRLDARTHGVQVADFFGVVSSEVYATFRRSRGIPNWQTLVAAP